MPLTPLEEDKIRLEAEQARQIIENPLFKRHNDDLRKNWHEAWEEADDPALREACWQHLRALNFYIDGLRDYLYTAHTLKSEE